MRTAVSLLFLIFLFVLTTCDFGPSVPVVRISSEAAFRSIGQDADYPLDGHYRLTGDIILSADNFEPIGIVSEPFFSKVKEIVSPEDETDETEFTEDQPFLGIFDGQGYAIRNLRVVTPLEEGAGGNEYVGLFRQIGYRKDKPRYDEDANGVVRNLVIELASGDESAPSLQGFAAVGALAGWNYGIVEKVEVRGGYVVASTAAGGLVGVNLGSIAASKVESSSVEGMTGVGGLVGFNGGSIVSNSARGTAKGNSSVGGLVGRNFETGKITKSDADVSVMGYQAQEMDHGDFSAVSLGGLVGSNEKGVIMESAAFGTVDSPAEYSNIGGFVGFNIGDIFDSYALGAVTGGKYVGGFVGRNKVFEFSAETLSAGEPRYAQGTITRSYARGAVTGDEFVGGFAGVNLYADDTSIVAEITASYYDVHLSGQAHGVGSNSTHAGVSGYNSSTTTLQHNGADVTRTDFADWDFDGNDAVWRWVAGQWPTLQWQSE